MAPFALPMAWCGHQRSTCSNIPPARRLALLAVLERGCKVPDAESPPPSRPPKQASVADKARQFGPMALVLEPALRMPLSQPHSKCGPRWRVQALAGILSPRLLSICTRPTKFSSACGPSPISPGSQLKSELELEVNLGPAGANAMHATRECSNGFFAEKPHRNRRWAMRNIIVALALLLCLYTMPACAQSIFTTQIGNRPAVVVSGEIAPNADEVFKAAAGQLQAPLIFLSSPGGSVAAALEIGRFIRMRALDTVVAEQQSCFSACALIWLGGAKRFMGQNARIGFHAAYRMRNGRAEESGVGNAMIGSYLANLGLPERVVVYVTLPGPDEAQVLTMADAQRIGLATSLLAAGSGQPARRAAQPEILPRLVPETPPPSRVTERQRPPVRVPPTPTGQTSRSGFLVPAGPTFRDEGCSGACPEMVVVPAGSYMMGSPNSEGDADERPQRRVTLHERVALGRFHVTVEEFRAFADATRRPDPASCWTIATNGGWDERQGRNWRNPGFTQTDRDPVVCVSWEDAQAYVAWLTQRTGKRYRLPSEAEWEWAARGRWDGVGMRWWWGDDGAAQCRSANGASQSIDQGNARAMRCSDEFTYTSPVGRFAANPFRLHDMAGNAWQWVEDCYRNTYQGAASDVTPNQQNAGTCAFRVLRGVSWNDNLQNLRVAERNWYRPGLRVNIIGFRVARAPG